MNLILSYSHFKNVIAVDIADFSPILILNENSVYFGLKKQSPSSENHTGLMIAAIGEQLLSNPYYNFKIVSLMLYYDVTK